MAEQETRADAISQPTIGWTGDQRLMQGYCGRVIEVVAAPAARGLEVDPAVGQLRPGLAKGRSVLRSAGIARSRRQIVRIAPRQAQASGDAGDALRQAVEAALAGTQME